MEFILEVLTELILEGTIEISKNGKVPKVIKYPLIFIIILLFIGVTFIIFFTGILAYKRINKICGILLVILGIVFLIASIIKFKKIYIKRCKNV